MNTHQDAVIARDILSEYRRQHRIATRKWNAIGITKSNYESNDWCVDVTYLPSANSEKIENKIGKIAERIGVFSLVDSIAISLEYEVIAHAEPVAEQTQAASEF